MRIPLTIALAFLAYSAAGYFGVPASIRYLAQHQAAAVLQRSVTVGTIAFNPYKLRLSISDVQVGARNGPDAFIEIEHLQLRLSWTSISRLAFVITRLSVIRPSIRLARVGPRRFDISDLIDSFANRQAPTGTSLSFAISNIEVSDGQILFDDRVLNRTHRFEDIGLAIPFIADLPTDVDNYVQPMLQMKVDGSPFRVTGKTRLFQSNFGSIVNLGFQNLDIIPFVGYVADALPFKLTQAALSATLQLNFVETAGQPQLDAAGMINLDNVAINDRHDSPLAQLKQIRATIEDFAPLADKLHFSSIAIDSPSSHLIINRDGTTNLSRLFATIQVKPPPPQPTQQINSGAAASSPPLMNPMAVAPSGAAVQSTSSLPGNVSESPNSHFAFSVDSLLVNNGTLDITDNTGPAPAPLKLQGIHLGLQRFSTTGRTPASYTFTTDLQTGGRILANGQLELESSRTRGKFSLVNIDLSKLRGLTARLLPASIVSGTISAQAAIQVALGAHFNLHAETAKVVLDQVELSLPQQPENILGWKHLTANVAQFDLDSRHFLIHELRGDALHLSARRDPDGHLNLISLFNAQPQVSTELTKAGNEAAPPRWQYRIESLMLDNTEADFEKDDQGQHLALRFAPINIHLNGLTNDLSKPFTFEADGNIAPHGVFKISGETAISPFQGRVHVNSERLDLAPLEPLIASALMSSKLNAKLTKAVVSLNGDIESELSDGKFGVIYRGDVTFGNVRIDDKLTGASFLRWYALDLDHLVMRYGLAQPSIQIGAMTLSDFYAHLILNRDGHLNLDDIFSGPSQPATSITRPTTNPSTGTSRSPLPADIGVGRFSLQDGQVNYLDNFIKPNYSAVITQLGGEVGTFGTRSRKAAKVLLDGKVNGTSPVSITGTIDPLAPAASLDLQADASQVQLPPLTPYSAKYTGYPITGGTLSGNVHYTLANDRLTATNHLIIDQLTFGERVENSNTGNLPVRLAIAVLKDPQGRIDLKIPVSGSLSDPDFDVGRLIWQGLLNVIMKAASSPFEVLASAVGVEQQNLSYLEFAPGSSSLSDAEREKLSKLAALLERRPWLKLQISGRVDPELDREGLRSAILEDEIKRRKAEDEHLNIAPGAIALVEVTPDEYNKYLRRVYRAADFARPLDFLGMLKRLPPAEMKKLLLANIKVTDGDLRRLAEARATTVFDELGASVTRSRLEVTAPNLKAETNREVPGTRVDFSLV